MYPLSFLLVIIVCYGVFVAYPSNGAIYAVTLIGNALTAGWYPVMWCVLSPLTLGLHTIYHQHGVQLTGKRHQALARPNHLPSHRLSLRNRVRQQLRADRGCHWPADIQERVCTSLQRSVLRRHGARWTLCDLDAGDVVGDLGDGARYKTIETGEDCGGEEGRGYFGGLGGSGLEKKLTIIGGYPSLAIQSIELET